MKGNRKYRNQYQFWRILDHLFGNKAPASRFKEKRQKALDGIVSAMIDKEPPGSTKQVDRKKNISSYDLKNKYIRKGIPIIIEGKANDWECVKKWSMDWLYENYCNDKVALFDPLSSSSEKVNYEVEETTLKDVLDAVKSGDTSKYSRFNRLLYDHPELVKDFDWKWLYMMRNRISSGKTFQVFIGGKGTRTTLHCASEHNLFTQVYGKKHWYLFEPKCDIYLDPPINRSPYFFSRFDPENPDYQNFPATKYLTVWECELNPGDVLFNPPNWWHQVTNMSHSIGVGFRWFNQKDSMKTSFVNTLLTILSTNPPIWTATKHRTDFTHIFKYMNSKSKRNA